MSVMRSGATTAIVSASRSRDIHASAVEAD